MILTWSTWGHMQLTGAFISISVPELITPSLCVSSVISGHSAGSPVLPYCANSMDIVVPRGQLNCTYSWSQPAVWYVLKVPDSKAAKKWRQKLY